MELIAEKREKLGKETKSLRKEGKIPAVIFGKKIESVPVTLETEGFRKLFNKAGETDLIDLKLDSKNYKIRIKNVQFNPVSGKIDHAELYVPDLTEKMEADIPVEVIGEEQNELIKVGEAMVFYVVDEITVKALPTDLPHAFIINVAELVNVGEGVTVAQLAYDKDKVEIVDLKPEDFVIRIDKIEVKEEEEEVVPVSEEEAVAAVEALEEKEPEEGEEEEGVEKKGKEKDSRDKK